MSGTQFAGSAFQTKSALTLGSALLSASPNWIILNTLGFLPFNSSLLKNRSSLKTLSSPPVETQTPPSPPVAPVTVGSNLIARIIAPPFSCLCIPQLQRIKEFLVEAYKSANRKISDSSKPVIKETFFKLYSCNRSSTN